MINGDMRYRVYNRCPYDIGVRIINGAEFNIPPKSFQIMTVNDILYVDSICRGTGFFTDRKLVPVDNEGNDVSLDELGLEGMPTSHFSEEEITSNLKQNIKKMTAWIEGIKDPAELDSIYNVAIKLELPLSKIQALKKVMPDKDWLDEMTE